MPGPKIIWLLLIIAAIATVAGIWQFSNSKGYRSRGRRRESGTHSARNANTKRLTDVRQLTGVEKKLYKESRRLIAEGKVAAGARILEQLNMAREAIQCLEDNGLIDEAAKILIRMQRHNRAGVVYVRHAMWDKAAQCFKVANMPLEVAKCAHQANNHLEAAEYFEKCGRIEDAANCLVDAGENLRAARKFFQLNNIPLAIKTLSRIPASQAEELAEEEVQGIIQFVANGSIPDGVGSILAIRNKLPETIFALCSNSHIQKAIELYKLAKADIGPQLMAEVNYHERTAEDLAALFTAVSQFNYAAVVLEKLGKFERAAASFEKAEDYDRAAYCYERAGLDSKVKEMSTKAKMAPVNRSSNRAGSPFSLANVSTRGDLDEEGSDGIERGEATAVIDMSANSSTPIRLAIPKERASHSVSATPPAPQSPPKVDNPPGAPIGKIPQPPKMLSGTFSLGAMGEDSGENAPPDTKPKTSVVDLHPLKNSANEDESDDEHDTDTDADTEAEQGGVEDSADKSHLSVPAPASEDGKASFHKAKFLVDLDFEQKNRLWSIGFTMEFTKG